MQQSVASNRNPIFRPMKAVDLNVDEILGNIHRLSYPLIGTPKFDGIRCLTLKDEMEARNCVPSTSSLKKIPNLHVYSLLADLPPGLDGELMSGKVFHDCESAVMSHYGEPDFSYHVFDWIQGKDYDERYVDRIARLNDYDFPPFVQIVSPTPCTTPSEAHKFVSDCVDQGYEGAVFRPPWSPYKCGRSTMRQGWMMKVKLFVDAEATVTGYKELERNNNPATVNARGYKERSSHSAAFEKGGTLGALICVDENKEEFKLGTGFTAAQRDSLWSVKESLVGKIVKYKYQLHGKKDAPRIPVFLGFRDKEDLC